MTPVAPRPQPPVQGGHPPGTEAAPDDPFDAALALTATGPLADFNRAGILTAADVHVAQRVSGLVGETSASARLALALTVRATRLGSVCLDLNTVREELELGAELDWPQPAAWMAELQGSPLVIQGDQVGAAPLRLDGGLLYLDKYWRQERVVARGLDARAMLTHPPDPQRLRAALQRVLAGPDRDRQRLAAAVAASRALTVIAGGPGTGKTTTVARSLAVLADQPGDPPRIALAAPTGKAAARLAEAVDAEVASLPPDDRARLPQLHTSTLHRLLGAQPGSRTRFRHHAAHQLPVDVLVVDETSMVSLTMMARLIEALPASAKLILVGDPDQLASVEAGAVLADIVARPAPAGGWSAAALLPVVGDQLDQLPASQRADLDAGIVHLAHRFRFAGGIAELADAIRAGDGQRALEVLRSGLPDVEFVEVCGTGPQQTEVELAAMSHDVLQTAADTHRAAAAADATLALARAGAHRVLCAHRLGPYGARVWSERLERWIAASVKGYGAEGTWYIGRPLLVKQNDYELGVFNGDSAVVVDDPRRGPMAAFATTSGPRLVSPSRLPLVDTTHAMTIHKSQGSQFESVTLILPETDSPLLSRELFYTAITRASRRVRVVAGADAVLQATERRVMRASGLRQIGRLGR
jgi:exodeoxyribonuclease V alpha subunit